MTINKLFIYLIIVFNISCNSNSIKVIKKEFSTINIDSLIYQINLDSNNGNKLQQLLAIKNNFTFNVIDDAKLNYKCFVLDTSINKYNYLEKIIKKEKDLKQTKIGGNILAKAFAAHCNIYVLNENSNQIINDCNKYFQYADQDLDSIYLLYISNTIAIAHMQLGENKQAIEFINKCIKYAYVYNDLSVLAKSINNLCISYQKQNSENYKIIKIIDIALKHPSMKLEDKEILKITRLNYTSNPIASRIEAAKKINKSANSILNKYLATDLLAQLYSQTKNHKKAIYHMHQTIADAHCDERYTAKLHLEIGKQYLQLHQTDSAQLYIDKCLQQITPTYTKGNQLYATPAKLSAENTIYDALLAKADLLTTAANTDTAQLNIALIHLQHAATVCHLLRQSMLYDESKYDMSGDLKLVTNKMIGIYYQLYTTTKNAKYAKLAYLATENSKAVALQDDISNQQKQSKINDTNYTKYLSIGRQLLTAEADIAATTNAIQLDSLQKIKNDLAQQISIYKTLYESVLPTTTKTITIQNIQDFLVSNKTNVLSFFAEDSSVYSIYLQGNNQQPVFTKHPIALLDSIALLNNYYSSKVIANVKHFNFLSHYAYRQLFTNIVFNQLPIIVLADGAIHNLPIDALLTDTANSSLYLVYKQQINYAYSISSLLLQQNMPANTNSKLLFINPFADNSIRHLAKLKNSSLEVGAIQQTMAVHQLNNNKATFANFSSSITGNSFLHISSHGSYLPNPKIEFYDSTVQINSLYHTPMQQQVVYLNMCQSGNGITEICEGNLSLARAFYSNGVHNIIYSLWNADDESSATISKYYYELLPTLHNSAAALHAAKIKYLQSVPKDKQPAFYWAMMQHLGNGDVTVSSNKWWYYLAAIIVIIISIACYRFYKNRRLQT